MSITQKCTRCIPALIVFAIIAFVCVITGCQHTPDPSFDDPGVPVLPATHVVTDAYGRTVTVPVDVSRVATVGSGARIVVYAGAVDKLVAVTDMETQPASTRPYTLAHAAAFAALPSTSNGNHLNETEIDAEALFAAAPEVIISSRSAAECDALQAKLGIPVIGVSYQDDLFGESIRASITCVGAACGTESSAAALIAQLDAWQADITSRVAKVTGPRPTAYAAGLNFKGSKGFTGTSAAYPVFDLLGVTNVANDGQATSNFDTTIEQIGAWDPEYIFANMANLSKLQADYDTAPAFFDGLTAFSQGNIYSQPSFTFNGTNTELAICDVYWTGAVLFPEAFAGCDTPEFLGSIMEAFLHEPVFEQLSAQGINFCRVDEWDK